MPSFVENINKLANGLKGSLVDELSYIQTEISTLQNDKVDKVAGKQLSTEDYTTTEKTKLASLDIHPAKHPVSILDGNGNFSKFVKTDAIGRVGFDDVTWSDIEGKPNSFNPNAHQHTLSEISDAVLKADKTYVDSGLALKANTTDVNNALALKADLSVVATDAELQSAISTLQPLSQKGQANGYVPLDAGGKIPNSYLNSLSTIDVYTASSQANMLLLSNVNVGDQCIRTDLASSNLFILTQTPATDINNWKQINTSASVMSVNGQTGVVNVSKSDVGLGNVDNTSDATKNVLSATKLTTSRTISLSGDASGSASFDGSTNTSITVTVADNSHNHTLSNISDFPSTVSSVELGYLDGVTSNIQTQLDAKPSTLKTINGASIVGSGDIVVGGGDMLKSTYDTTNNGIVDRAETADKLATARTIGGVSFNGTANIDLPGVNTTGNQNTTGNATTATTANALNSSNSYIGAEFTANAGAFRAQNFGGVATNGVVYFGNANSFIFKGGGAWNFNNQQGFNNVLDTNGNIVTANGGTWNINATTATSAGSCTGNSATATKLTSSQGDWSAGGTIGNVVGMLGWKNYGNGHVIFDASNSTSPTGSAVNNTNSAAPWSPTFPTLMGWNGSQTYGVRVDSARVADSTAYASAFTTAVGSAPSYACRAWVNFDGTGTVATRASGNVSSITDNGVGDYTVNFTTAMLDVNYSCSVTPSLVGAGGQTSNVIQTLTGSVRVHTTDAINNVSEDTSTMSIQVFR